MPAAKTSGQLACLGIVALGDQGLDQQAVPLLRQLPPRIKASVSVQGCERAVEATAGERGSGDLD